MQGALELPRAGCAAARAAARHEQQAEAAHLLVSVFHFQEVHSSSRSALELPRAGCAAARAAACHEQQAEPSHLLVIGVVHLYMYTVYMSALAVHCVYEWQYTVCMRALAGMHVIFMSP